MFRNTVCPSFMTVRQFHHVSQRGEINSRMHKNIHHELLMLPRCTSYVFFFLFSFFFGGGWEACSQKKKQYTTRWTQWHDTAMTWWCQIPKSLVFGMVSGWTNFYHIKIPYGWHTTNKIVQVLSLATNYCRVSLFPKLLKFGWI